MDVFESIEKRFSVRSYKDQPIAPEVLQKILEAAWHAPCSCNLQLMQYIVITDIDIREKLAKIATAKMLWAPVNC